MSTFLGLIRHEYAMSVRRWVVWLAFLVGSLFVAQSKTGIVASLPGLTLTQWAGITAIIGNLAPPLIGGIAIADRLVRDRGLGVRELVWATPLPRRTYVLGKYAGAVLGVLTPALVTDLAITGLFVARGLPIALLAHTLVAFLAINVPTMLFVGAFSLACPEVLPLRVYQILFVGYWPWATEMQWVMMPTVNGTVLGPKGDWVARAFFGAPDFMSPQLHTPVEALLNVAVLLALAAAALVALERHLAWQARRA